MSSRKTELSELDRCIDGLSNALFTVFGSSKAVRAYPVQTMDSDALSDADKTSSARYMRVNHVGEVCAQALYQSQALTARNAEVRASMQSAAQEETDHLAWCEQRLDELGGRKSRLNPIWYSGSFALGALAGLAGDKWNLGFVAETEKQVVKHLENHLGLLPESDQRSREIVEQMKQDEQHHAEQAAAAGAADLPQPVRTVMQGASRVMTTVAHWI